MVTKRKFRMRTLYGYCRLKTGFCQEQNQSLYEIVCQALAKDGKKKPSNVSHKSWVYENASFICDAMGHAPFIPGGKKKKPEKKTLPKVAGKDFLETFEWRKLRMEALKKYGAKCQCCGASPATGAVMNVDHIKPRKTHPELALDISNLQILCAPCNHGKGNWDSTDWRENT